MASPPSSSPPARPPSPERNQPLPKIKKPDPYDVRALRPSRLSDAPVPSQSHGKKPVALSAEGRKYLDLALRGNLQVHYYTKELEVLSAFQKKQPSGTSAQDRTESSGT